MSRGNSHPNLVVLAVYKSHINKGMWKGFCAPYGVTTQATTCEEAKTHLEELVELYEEGLKKYNYPKHLVFQELQDVEDNKVLKLVWKEVTRTLGQKMKEERNFIEFTKQSNEGSLKLDGGIVSFYQPSFVMQT
ncbi:hypothetical protein HYW58_00190 [Candidatus Kaiserbacteria bacterium]|nr:hypothetical protein [Candidatus Kaiserbacteria bacterium]